MERLPSIRASDADREHAAERLRHATAEGRLSAQELEERLEALFATRTYGELDALLADLPVTRSSSPPPARAARWVGAAAAATLAAAMLGMLAVIRRHAEAAGVGPRSGQVRGEGPFADAHHLVVVTASMVGVLAVLLTCAALAWALVRSRAASDV